MKQNYKNDYENRDDLHDPNDLDELDEREKQKYKRRDSGIRRHRAGKRNMWSDTEQ